MFIKEIGIQEIFVSYDPLQDDLRELGWIWEEEETLTKLLGFFIGSKISSQRMLDHLKHALENRLRYARKAHHSLMMRVVIANQLVSCALFYMLQAWPSAVALLEEFDRSIKDFIWSGKDTKKRPRVDEITTTLPKDQGA